MPIYQYLCPTCDSILEIVASSSSIPESVDCDRCRIPTSKRVFSFGTKNVLPQTRFEPHFNASVGAYVSSWADFKSKLSACEEEQARVTGFHTPYHAIEVGEGVDAFGVTEEGLDATRRHQTATGQREVRRLVL